MSKEPWWGASALWKRRSIRRAVFLCRFAWLLADFSLDISLTVWLFANDEGNSGVVCAVFIGLAQVAITLVAFFNLVPLLFGSICGLLLMSPIMLAIMPVLAPIMAVWNAINPGMQSTYHLCSGGEISRCCTVLHCFAARLFSSLPLPAPSATACLLPTDIWSW